MESSNANNDYNTSHRRDKPVKVAIVGTGLAGLTIAYLLQRDPRHRYSVTAFECGSQTSLDAASLTVRNITDGTIASVDVPMRAFTGGYYRYLIAMYQHLGIQFHWQPLEFVFLRNKLGSEEKVTNPKAYFVHASDYHKMPRPRIPGASFSAFFMEFAYVLFWFLWFTVCCHVVPVAGSDETLREYLRKIHVSDRFTSYYLLPLLSAISTCTHEEMLRFPSNDVVQYRKKILRQRQYVVTGGIRRVREALARGFDLQLGSRVLSVVAEDDRKALQVQTVDLEGQTAMHVREFDRIILAVPPNVAADLFKPSSHRMSQIPVRSVQTTIDFSALDCRSEITELASRSDEATVSLKSESGPTKLTAARAARQFTKPPNVTAEQILLATYTNMCGWTQATHKHGSEISVTSSPGPPAKTTPYISQWQFTRVLRTTGSRKIIQEIFENGERVHGCSGPSKGWKNGENGVWMVGAWCWDGMVLLEGAVVSAMRVAQAFDVDIPWAARQYPI